MQDADKPTWTSAIDEELTPVERTILAAYRSPSAGELRRQVRLSVQYAVGAALFLYLSFSSNQPLYGLVVYAMFIAWMAVRLLGARRIAGVMPQIIDKYEKQIGGDLDSKR